MIVRPRPGSFELWVILRGSILPAIAARVGVIVAFSLGLAFIDRARPDLFPDFTSVPFTLLGIALSIFLGFRNNACYERWWEARRQWGQLVAEARGLARDGTVLLPDPESRRLCHRIIAFAHALRDQLRGNDAASAEPWLPPGEWTVVSARRSKPDAILERQAREIGSLRRGDGISDEQYTLFAGRLQAITNIQTACERLNSTPTPFTYTLLLHRTAWVFCLLLPFGLVGGLGMITPIATALLGYAFFGLDALGEELEEPFGRSQNAVPLDALVRAVEIAVLESLGSGEVPAPLLPIDHILL